MQIDRESLICGVKPVRLKALMQLDRFSTPTAMAVLKISEPQVGDTLTQLTTAGWISWEGTRHDVDLWSSMPMGHRLAASRSIRRFPVSQGRALLPEIVETARRLNADPHASHRICGIFLFGSVLTGDDDGDAGDIDLVVDTRRRRLPNDAIDALIAAEEHSMPEHLGFHARLNRQHADLCRAIKKVSNKISLHGFGDVRAFSAVYRELYRYDVDIEAETAVDAETKRAQPDGDRPREEVRHVVPPTFATRAWPTAPNIPVVLEPMDAKPFRLAQHLWMKGVDPAGIATRLELPVPTVITYLAGRDGARVLDLPPFDARLERMVDQAFARASPYGVVIEIDKRHRGDVTIRCEIVNEGSFEGLACIRRFAASDAWISGRCDLVPFLEPVADAAWAWWDKVRERLVGLDFHTVAVRLPSHPRAEAMGRRRPDLRPLPAPMNDLLDRLSPRRSGIGRRDERIELRREMGQDRLYHCSGEADSAGSSETRLTRRDQPEAWRRIKAVLVSQAADIRALGDFTIAITGR